MLQSTLSSEIDQLRQAVRESESRRQAAETRLADLQRRLGIARNTIAAQDDEIDMLTGELARARSASAPLVPDTFVADAVKFFNVYSISSRRPA